MFYYCVYALKSSNACYNRPKIISRSTCRPFLTYSLLGIDTRGIISIRKSQYLDNKQINQIPTRLKKFRQKQNIGSIITRVYIERKIAKMRD